VAAGDEFGVAARQQRVDVTDIAHRIPTDHECADEHELALALAAVDDQLPRHDGPRVDTIRRHKAAARLPSEPVAGGPDRAVSGARRACGARSVSAACARIASSAATSALWRF